MGKYSRLTDKELMAAFQDAKRQTAENRRELGRIQRYIKEIVKESRKRTRQSLKK